MTTTEDRVAKLEADSTANAIVQRELTESIEKLTRKVEEGFHSIENHLGRIDDTVTELPTLREIDFHFARNPRDTDFTLHRTRSRELSLLLAATVRHIVEESQS